MRDATQMKNRVKILQRVETGMIAKRAFCFQFIEVDVPFQNNF